MTTFSDIFIMMLVGPLLYVILFSFVLLAILVTFLRFIIQTRHLWLHSSNELSKSVAFFHPYCNAGGGGERVLWCAILAIRQKYPDVRCVVYTGDTDATPEEILSKAEERFNLVLDRKAVEFIYLRCRCLVEARFYPMFTLLGQSLGSMVLGLEALLKFVPTIYLDTMGYAFTLPIFKCLGNCRVGCYVHYPTISTNMLDVVVNRTRNFNNSSLIARSFFLSTLKLQYYKMFACLYAAVGRVSQVTMVNSSWTKDHIEKIWQPSLTTHRVYPPCNVMEFEDIDKENQDREKWIVSVGQFRPEKNHALQIRAFHKFLQSIPQDERHEYRLVIVGGARNDEDKERAENLRHQTICLGIDSNVDFAVNSTFAELKQQLAKATIGLHTMLNEHFGIGVVECMAAGLIVLVHNSGGPKMDIVIEKDGHRTGFLATDENDFARHMKTIFDLAEDEKNKIRNDAKESVKRFSDEEFKKNFMIAIQPLFTK